jgi:hypothetical protein
VKVSHVQLCAASHLGAERLGSIPADDNSLIDRKRFYLFLEYVSVPGRKGRPSLVFPIRLGRPDPSPGFRHGPLQLAPRRRSRRCHGCAGGSSPRRDGPLEHPHAQWAISQRQGGLPDGRQNANRHGARGVIVSNFYARGCKRVRQGYKAIAAMGGKRTLSGAPPHSSGASPFANRSLNAGFQRLPLER